MSARTKVTHQADKLVPVKYWIKEELRRAVKFKAALTGSTAEAVVANILAEGLSEELKLVRERQQ